MRWWPDGQWRPEAYDFLSGTRRGAEVVGVDLHVLLPVQVEPFEGEVQEIADADAFAGGYHVVVGCVLLEHMRHMAST